jgi:hypothetical protein
MSHPPRADSDQGPSSPRAEEKHGHRSGHDDVMTGEPADTSRPQQGSGSRLLPFLSAMFVLVVDTSLMDVSISAVVRDLDTTVSGVQSAIAREALVSAAFILGVTLD